MRVCLHTMHLFLCDCDRSKVILPLHLGTIRQLPDIVETATNFGKHTGPIMRFSRPVLPRVCGRAEDGRHAACSIFRRTNGVRSPRASVWWLPSQHIHIYRRGTRPSPTGNMTVPPSLTEHLFAAISSLDLPAGKREMGQNTCKRPLPRQGGWGRA